MRGNLPLLPIFCQLKKTVHLQGFFPLNTTGYDEDMKYLGFFLKPNDYHLQYWHWFIENLEKCLKQWSHKLLSSAGRLVLVKSVLEAIPVYWMSLA